MLDLEASISMFRCPETGCPVDLVDPARLRRLNDAIREGTARTLGDQRVERPLEAALRPDGADFVYPVRDGIPDFTPESRIAL